MKIRDVMTEQLETVERTAPIRAAADRMRACGIGSVAVMDRGQLAGFVTDRDIVVRGVALGLDSDLPVSTVMTTSVITCYSGDPLEVAQGLMEAKAVRRLVVVDAFNRPVGLLSLDDLATVPWAAPRAGQVLGRLNAR